MRSKDVQKEIDIAVNYKKKLIEFKIDQTPHTQLFKHVFDGIKWVEGVNLKKGLEALTERIFEEKVSQINLTKDNLLKKSFNNNEPKMRLNSIKLDYSKISRKIIRYLISILFIIFIAYLIIIFYINTVNWLDIQSSNSEQEVNGNFDLIPPEIILLGDDIVYIKKGGFYLESGAIATDNLDSTVKVEIEGYVDTKISGTYILKYKAVDSSGNISVILNRFIIVE